MSIFNSLRTTDSPDEPESPYDVALTDETITASDGSELAVWGADGELYAGQYLREQIETLGETDEPAIPIGYAADEHGTTIARLPLKRLYVHLALTGITGSGKSTVARTIELALAFAGEGFVHIDPKGDGDAMELVRALPDERMDDVIWVEPASDTFEQTVAVNLLESPSAESQNDRDAAAARQVDAVKSLFDTSEYWGPTMEFIVETLARAMIRSPTNYALIDMPFILYKIEYLEAFAESVEDPFIGMAAQKLTDLDDQEILPVWKRMAKHMASATKRPLISERESTINFTDLIAEKKIVIMQPPDAGGDISAFLALIYLERYWTAQRQRARQSDGHPSPYFAFVDESDTVLSANVGVEDMLARARSARFSIALISQYAGQWESVSPSIARAIKNNAKNKLALSTDDRESARYMMEAFREHDADDLTGMDNHAMWAKIPLQTGGDSEHRVDTFPPMPPRRSAAEAREHLRTNLEAYGKPPVTDDEILSNLEVGTPEDFAEMLRRVRDGEDATVSDIDATDEDSQERAILKAVFDESIHSTDLEPGAFVPRTRVESRLRDYLNASDDGIAKVWNAVDGVPEKLLERDQRDGETHLRTTERGVRKIVSTGDNENAGGIDHRELLKNAYAPLTELGLCVEVVTQDEEGGSLPDGYVSPEFLRDVDTSELSLSEAAELHEEFTTEHETVARFTDGERIVLEAEHETGESKPGQTVLNLAQALDSGERCLLVAYPTAARRVENALSNPPCVRSQDADGSRVFYNRRDLKIDGEQMLRPAGPKDTVWRFDASSEEYVLTDSDGHEHARFASHEAVFSDAGAYPATSEMVDDAEAWKPVRRPVIPEREFDGGVPDADCWTVLAVGSEEVDTALALVEDGEMLPLQPDAGMAVTSGDNETDDSVALPDAPAALFEVLCMQSEGEVTTSEAHELATEYGGDLLDVSRRSIGNYLSTLVDAGVVSVDKSGKSNRFEVLRAE